MSESKMFRSFFLFAGQRCGTSYRISTSRKNENVQNTKITKIIIFTVKTAANNVKLVSKRFLDCLQEKFRVLFSLFNMFRICLEKLLTCFKTVSILFHKSSNLVENKCTGVFFIIEVLDWESLLQRLQIEFLELPNTGSMQLCFMRSAVSLASWSSGLGDDRRPLRKDET